ncbi:MAG: glycosyl hydrolase 53 family protein [Bacteroidota bacterium]
MRSLHLLWGLGYLLACEPAPLGVNDPTEEEEPETPELKPESILAVDLSALPQIEASAAQFYTASGAPLDMLPFLKEMGLNTVRLRLWVHPENQHSGFEEVEAFAQRIHSAGLQLWLTVHYSDTWADPGQQIIPDAWAGMAYPIVKDSLLRYTEKVIASMQPDILQLGNEINSGWVHPIGDRHAQQDQFLDLLGSAAQVVRNSSPETQILLHFAGLEGAEAFFAEVEEVDYDLIGLSYYPLWHGKDLAGLKTTLQTLGETYNKGVLIAETAYPFTLDWADHTNNIVGLAEQLILPSYPATPQGQKDFMRVIRSLTTQEVAMGRGYCYWGGELIAWKGPEATDGSPWENQALFDFEGQALPVWEVFLP